MNAPITLAQLDRGVKKCRDCVHCLPGDQTAADRCGYTVMIAPATGEEGHWYCNTVRESRYDGACGERAIHFAPTEDCQAKRSVRKMQQVRAIEAAITHLYPDVYDAQQILAALTASLSERYEYKVQRAIDRAEEFSKSLDEVEEMEVYP